MMSSQSPSFIPSHASLDHPSASAQGGTLRVGTWKFFGLASAVGLGAFLLRINQIGVQELWLDEAFSFYRATVPGGLRPDVVGDVPPPFYYSLLRVWIPLVGTSEGALRLLSAICGTLFVLAAIWAGCELFTRSVGLWSGGFAALAPLHIYYSQEARAYALLTLLIMLVIILLWRALRAQTWTAWGLTTLAALLALYSHYFAILALLPATLLVFVHPERSGVRQQLCRLAAVMLICGVLVIPWVWWSFVLVKPPGGMDWVSEMWQRTPPALAIPKTLEIFGLGSQAGSFPALVKIFPYLEFPVSLRLLGLALLLCLGIWIAIPWMDQRLEIPGVSARKGWLWTMLLFPLAGLWLVSLLKPVYVVGRYDIVAFPAFTLLIGLALTKLQRLRRAGPVLVISVTVALLIPIGVKLVAYYKMPPMGLLYQPSARLTAGLLASTVRNDDLVVFTGLRGLPVVYYLSRLGYQWTERTCRETTTGRQFGCRMFPRETEHAPANYNVDRVLHAPEAVRADLEEFLHALPQPGGVVWVVFTIVSFSQGHLEVLKSDSLLMNELEGMGFHSPANASLQGTLGVVPFMRPHATEGGMRRTMCVGCEPDVQDTPELPTRR